MTKNECPQKDRKTDAQMGDLAKKALLKIG